MELSTLAIIQIASVTIDDIDGELKLFLRVDLGDQFGQLSDAGGGFVRHVQCSLTCDCEMLFKHGCHAKMTLHALIEHRYNHKTEWSVWLCSTKCMTF